MLGFPILGLICGDLQVFKELVEPPPHKEPAMRGGGLDQ
jgi:hypothetical protein